ncbi:MAG TPA: methyltransferase domain-containing protein [Xanthobacteraceae bacterium]|jgi:SAM-dependent methyltransferase|nr:methyltransferase domain-containing protein [Xanthobacteraceae bacterium]
MSSASTYHASNGAAYEHFLGRWTKRLAEPLLDFGALPVEGDLLDVGTGTGSVALAMAARWPSRPVAGVDVSEAYIGYARTKTKGAIPAFEVGDAAALRFDDATFAGVTAQLVLNFIPNAAKAISEIKRVTRPGGTVVAAVWDFRGGLVYQRIFWDTAAGIDPGAAVARDRLFSRTLALPDGLPNLFADAGFADIQRSSLTIRMDYADFNDYWQPLLGGQGPVGTYVTALSAEKRARIEAAVKQSYCSGAPDGPRSMTATAWAVRARV